VKLGGAPQQGLRACRILAEFGDSRAGQKTLHGVQGFDLPRDRLGLVRVAAQNAGRHEVVLDEIPERLNVARIETQRRIDLLAKAPRQERLLKQVSVLRHHAVDLRELPVVAGHAAIQADGLRSQLEGRSAVSECGANLRQKRVRVSRLRRLAQPLLHHGPRALPVSRLDQLFGRGLLRQAQRRRGQNGQNCPHIRA